MYTLAQKKKIKKGVNTEHGVQGITNICVMLKPV